jgi:glutaredoxin 3
MIIEINSKTDCPYCQLAKDYLRHNEVPYVERLFDDDAHRKMLYDQIGLVGDQRTVPQIFLVEQNGQRTRIGGYTDLIKSDTVARHHVGTFDMEY